jgi:hypothetical protein
MPVDFDPVMDHKREMERTPLVSQESLRVRCPDCRRLYLVQFSDIQEAKPRFECVQCRSRFWLSLPDIEVGQEVVGLHCGVATDKLKTVPPAQAQEGLPPHSSTLTALWKKLMGDYGDESSHAEFLRACQRERNLAYAAAQYNQMLSLMPTDEITHRKLKEIQALASTMLPPRTREPRVPRRLPYVWQWPLIGLTAVIIVGMLSPLFRNLVGVAALILFAGFALRVQFRRR